MISTINREKNKSSFTRVKSVDSNYPLYGKVVFEPNDALEKLNKEKNTILVNENIFKNLNLQSMKLLKFRIRNLKLLVM